MLARADNIPEIVKRAKPAVVEIVALDKKGSTRKFGTGFFISSDGQLVTNYHVVDGASSLLAIDYLGTRFPLEPVKYDPGRDLALLKCQVKEVPFLKLRESDYYHPNEIAEGEKVIVIGNPSGFFGTVSEGIVSGFRKRSWDVLLMQITAPISPGSSGSPVLDENGEIVGIATLTSPGQNLNFAIAVRNLAVLLLEMWIDKYPVAPRWKPR
jgi:S1-C subfamily serine protease